MAGQRNKEFLSHGVRAFNSRHKDIRRIRRWFAPTGYGHRIWPAGWLLVDYLSARGLPKNLNIMEVGCGWGLPGVYCAKKFRGRVTAVDYDPEVFPYLQYHARMNGVEVRTVDKDMTALTVEDFAGFDVLIGADICFWHHLVAPVRKLIDRALQAGVRLVVIADQGRPTINEVGGFVEAGFGGRQFYWRSLRPYRNQGQIVEIDRLKLALADRRRGVDINRQAPKIAGVVNG